jgi:hypothetical protein
MIFNIQGRIPCHFSRLRHLGRLQTKINYSHPGRTCTYGIILNSRGLAQLVPSWGSSRVDVGELVVGTSKYFNSQA